MIEADYFYIFLSFASLFVYVAGIVAIVYFAYNFYKKTINPKNMTIENSGSNTARPNISILSVFFSIVLTIAFLYLFSAIWSDLSRIVPDPYEIKSNPYIMQEKAWSMPIKPSQSFSDIQAHELSVLVWHILFVLPLIISATLFYFEFGKKNKQHNILILPYLIASMLIFFRLLIDVAGLITSEYERLGTYAIIVILIIIVSALAYWTQAKKEQENV